jgi:hypothetical protein
VPLDGTRVGSDVKPRPPLTGESLPLDQPLRVGNGLDPSADLLRQLDDDSRRAADVAEPVAVLVTLQLADQFSAVGSQAGNDGVDVLDGECDVADTRGVGRRVRVVALV